MPHQSLRFRGIPIKSQDGYFSLYLSMYINTVNTVCGGYAVPCLVGCDQDGHSTDRHLTTRARPTPKRVTCTTTAPCAPHIRVTCLNIWYRFRSCNLEACVSHTFENLFHILHLNLLYPSILHLNLFQFCRFALFALLSYLFHICSSVRHQPPKLRQLRRSSFRSVWSKFSAFHVDSHWTQGINTPLFKADWTENQRRPGRPGRTSSGSLGSQSPEKSRER